MKKLFIIPLMILSLGACNQMDPGDETDEPEVYDAAALAEASQYVNELMNSLRNGTFNLSTFRCPDLQWIHIEALMEYGKSEEIIGDDPKAGSARALPAGPYSSELMFQVSEGMFALWMVEAARIHTLDPQATGVAKGMLGWPSRNPFVQKVNPGTGTMEWYVNDPAVQTILFNAYADWWKEAGGRKSAAKINPLEKTGYVWF